MKHPTYNYDEIAENIFYPAYPEIIEDVIRATGITEGTFLDIGCGGGHLGFALMKRTNMQGCFLDIQQGAVECAQIRAKELGFEHRSRIFRGNVEEMPFADAEFDLIISRGSVPFWENQKKAFQEILRVMKSGGKAYIGGGLGSLETQREIEKKMEAIGKRRYDLKSDKRHGSHALTIEGYRELLETLPCIYRVISNEQHRRLILLEKI